MALFTFVQLGGVPADLANLAGVHSISEDECLLDQIRGAYKANDPAASRKYHRRKNRILSGPKNNSSPSKPQNRASDANSETETSDSPHCAQQEDAHKGAAGEFIKSIIFGGLDGVLTVFAIVASISGSDLNVTTVLVLGFAKLFGGALSMGIGDFLSEKAEIDFIKSEFAREAWEFEHYPEGELEEMIAIYVEKGVAEADAKLILSTMAQYPSLFLEHMMMEELEMDSTVIDDNPLKNGAITFASFMCFGTIPLLSYVVSYLVGAQAKLNVAVLLTLATLFGLGAVKGHYTNNSVWKSGSKTALLGVIAAGSAYLTAYLSG